MSGGAAIAGRLTLEPFPCNGVGAELGLELRSEPAVLALERVHTRLGRVAPGDLTYLEVTGRRPAGREEVRASSSGDNDEVLNSHG